MIAHVTFWINFFTSPQFSILYSCVLRSCSLIIRFSPYFLLIALYDAAYSVDTDHLLITDVNAVAASGGELIRSLLEQKINVMPVGANETLRVTLRLNLLKIIELVCDQELVYFR